MTVVRRAPCSNASADALAWYALSVRCRGERMVAERLSKTVAEVFLPARIVRRAWSDRVVKTEDPLFPGYLFVQTSLSARTRTSLLRVPGVHAIVGHVEVAGGRTTCAVPEREIEALRIIVRSERAVDPIERLVRGKHVSIVAGPLRGASGVVEEAPDGHRRLVVQVALLGRGVRTVLRADDVVEATPLAA